MITDFRGTPLTASLKLIDNARIQSDDPENFHGWGGGARSTTALPLQILCQDECDKVLPLTKTHTLGK